MPTRTHRRLALPILAALALACAPDPNGPEQMTARFWEAVAASEFAAAAELCDGASPTEVRQLATAHPFDSVTLGEPLHGEAHARVPTHLGLGSEGRALSFETHLVELEGEWRVDLRASRRALTRELLAGSLEGIHEALRESGEAFVEEFEARALEASEALRETLEELEESLHDPAEPEPPATTQRP